MTRLLQLISIGLLGLWLLGGSSTVSRSVIDITCPQRSGCFLKIGRALQQAPDGAELRIGPGLYYEKPLEIKQDIILRGAGAHKTEIRLVDRNEVALRVSSENRPVEVTIEALTLQGGPLFFSPTETDTEGDDLGFGFGAALVLDGDADHLLQVKVQRGRIFGGFGVSVLGSAQLALQRSTITAQAAGISAMGGEIEVVESRIAGSFFVQDEDAVGLSLFFASRVDIRNSTINGWNNAGVVHQAPVPEDRDPDPTLIPTLKLEGNLIGGVLGNGTGVILAGLVKAVLEGNRFLNNEEYGIALAWPPCVPPESRGEAAEFRGTIEGQDNEFSGNGQDLCPADYPWPEGFTAP